MLLNAVSGSFSAWQQHCRFYKLIVIYHSEMIQFGRSRGKTILKQALLQLTSPMPQPLLEEEVALPSQMSTYELGITFLVTLQTLSPI